MVNTGMTKYKFYRKENYVKIKSITSTFKGNEGDPVTQITAYDFSQV